SVAGRMVPSRWTCSSIFGAFTGHRVRVAGSSAMIEFPTSGRRAAGGPGAGNPTTVGAPRSATHGATRDAPRARSRCAGSSVAERHGGAVADPLPHLHGAAGLGVVHEPGRVDVARLDTDRADQIRSEEHTSELQSRENLVCRLLL